MLSFTDLVALDKQLATTPTLTLYLDGRTENPAWRTAWRRALKQEEGRLRTMLADAPHAEREAFSDAVELLEQHLSHRRGALDAPGWLGVVAKGEVVLDAPLRGPVPTHGHWGVGVALAPFLCAPSGCEDAWVCVVDSRASRIFRCDDQGVHRVDAIRTIPHFETDLAPGTLRRGRFLPGTRGGVGRDAAERERRAARGRMLHTLAEHVRALPPAGAVFVGGTPQLMGEAVAALRMAGVQNVIEAPALGARARVNEISRAVHEGLVQAQRELDLGMVQEIERRFADDGLGLAGAAATGRALDERSVQALVLSETFVTSQPAVAEVFVRSALAQGADVNVVSDEASRVLEESGGAGVLLRFSPFRAVAAAEGELAAV
jgi:hypothetical protein